MSAAIEVAVPDIGDFSGIPIVDVLVAVGDTVEVEQGLVEIESDKATFEVPSTVAGTVKELRVAVGDKVSEGTVIAVIDLAQGSAAASAGESAPESASAAPEAPAAPAESAAPAPPASAASPTAEPSAEDFERGDLHAQVLVLGSGPGGYSAAFRAADLGLQVVMVERYATLGGVCLNVGCIPSKALLHAAKVIAEAHDLGAHGVAFGEPTIDVDALRAHKEGIVGQLTKGVAGMAKTRNVEVVTGEGTFTGPHHLQVASGDGETTTISFDHAIIAAGSTPVALPGIPSEDPRVWDSTGALELRDIPERLLVIGGGIIGLEMATVYDALGSKVTVVELMDQLIPGCDKDLVRPLAKRIEGRYEAIHLGVKVDAVEAKDDGLHVTFAAGADGGKAPEDDVFDAVLVSVGRTPNGAKIGAEAAGVTVTERGFIPVDAQLRTNVPHILAIGDIVGQPMLAHKASHEAHVAAEVIAGHSVAMDVRGIPSVAYTEPEVAWVGLTETQAKADGTSYEVAAFPWVASARALTVGGGTGKTKLLVDPESRQILGAGIVGPNAGELIAEPGFALEMGADVGDLALTIHAHPTLSESIMLAAEVAEGTVTDLPPKRKR
ncbi:MAG: dihydrolipoyl dehydrogenase [Solirubrobacteraceae bacterium]|nr:dihydrolipoyl dehydrogenase [Solirubrobacteraceae bacterium]